MNDAANFSTKNIAVVCNPLAGVGKAIRLSDQICIELSQRKIAYHLFKEEWPQNFNGFTDVFIVGGDGTLNYFINQYPNIKLPLVIFNGGTGNDVHWLLYGKKNFEEQMELALTGLPKPIDAGRCNERFFINGVGIGFEGAVAKSLAGKKKRPGKTSFLIAVLKKIFFYRSKKYKVSSDDMPYLAGMAYPEQRQLMISVTNGRRAGGGFLIAPVAAADDGLLDVVMIKAITPLLRLRWLPVIEKGKHFHLSFVHHFQTRKIIMESDQSIQSHLDGEAYTSNKIEIEILPSKFLFRY